MFKKKNEKPQTFVPKSKFYLTAVLLSPLKPGQCATFIYNGNVIRTSIVKNILEAATDYVRFETRHSIYTIGYIRDDSVSAKKTA